MRRFDWAKSIGRGVQIGSLVAGVNAARETDWPVIVILLLMAMGMGAGEGIRETSPNRD